MFHIWVWTDLLSPLGTALTKHPHRSVNSAAACLKRPFPARPITSCSSSTATSAPADSFFCVTMVSRILCSFASSFTMAWFARSCLLSARLSRLSPSRPQNMLLMPYVRWGEPWTYIHSTQTVAWNCIRNLLDRVPLNACLACHVAAFWPLVFCFTARARNCITCFFGKWLRLLQLPHSDGAIMCLGTSIIRNNSHFWTSRCGNICIRLLRQHPSCYGTS